MGVLGRGEQAHPDTTVDETAGQTRRLVAGMSEIGYARTTVPGRRGTASTESRQRVRFPGTVGAGLWDDDPEEMVSYRLSNLAILDTRPAVTPHTQVIQTSHVTLCANIINESHSSAFAQAGAGDRQAMADEASYPSVG
jgi:hypothetical protein